MRALIVLPGTPPSEARLAAVPADVVIAADGGGNTLDAWGRVPDVLVGDLDSIRGDVLERFRGKGVTVEAHDARKLHGDGVLALEAALARGARDLVIAGATGGRLDHVLANLHLLRRGVDAGARVRLVEPGGDAWTVSADAPLDLDVAAGTTVTVLPLTDRVDGVTLVNFEYALEDAAMRAGDPYGLSNVARAGPQRVTCRSGALVVVVPSEGSD